jgi:hypothetical protein
MSTEHAASGIPGAERSFEVDPGVVILFCIWFIA